MAAVTCAAQAAGCAIAALTCVASCGDLVGLAATPPTPLATVRVRVTGDVTAVRDPAAPPAELRVGLAWATLSFPDPSCLPPVESREHAAVIAAGCLDSLRFTHSFEPIAGVAVGADGTASVDVLALPTYLVGDVYAQIAYASIFVFDYQQLPSNSLDFHTTVLYGASFSSMARPDTRLAFRHGGYDDRLTFYPRRGCPAPPEGFSLVSAGGFTLEQALEAQARGEVPVQDAAACRVDPLDREVEVALQPPAQVRDADCVSFGTSFRAPDARPLGLDPSEVTMACTSLPDFGTGRTGRRQALVAPLDPPGGCKYVDHLILRGCYGDPTCDTPDWDVPAPPWWPCPAETTP